ncbi:MAG: redoxin domain-containing protein [Candidatus Kapaibacteriota bacterium]|jgi:thiol-disulfide isomerase/thioredoxin
MMTLFLRAALCCVCAFIFQTPHCIGRSGIISVQDKTVRVVVFLADGCPICQKYAPTLRRLHEKYRMANVEFIGIFPDTFTTDAEVEAFAKQYPCGFPMKRDSAQTLAKILKARTTPEVFVFSSKGQIVYRGRIDNEFPTLGARRSVITENNLDDTLFAITHQKAVRIKKTSAVGCLIEYMK